MDDESCLSLIHLAVGLDCKHREAIIELLIKNHVDLNCPGKSENVEDVRPLHIAAMWGYDMTVKLLLYHGADASLRDEAGLSPVDYASIFDNYLCISLLLRYGSLNATASAWSAIMDRSLGDESRNGESSFDENRSLLNNSLDTDGDSLDQPRTSLSQTYLERRRRTSNLSRRDDNNNNDKRDNLRFKIDNLLSMIEENDQSVEDGDDEYDPYDRLNQSEVNKNLELENQKLRLELRLLGRNPGPITNTTKKTYAKLLTLLKSKDKELVYSPRTKTTSELNGYSNELNSILTGKFSIKQALELEKTFMQISATRDYHGPKQFFNYILIDPRISQNLPDQVMELMSDSDTSVVSRVTSPNNNNNNYNHIETPKPKKNSMSKLNRRFDTKLFTKFLESIFYIGKGQKRRDFMHLYDALADRDSITQKKIDRIRSIWNDGYGVVSLHIFHNITSKEALTREALMIEAIGLSNLTNLVKGTIQFRLGWNEHKRNMLGALLLHRAYTQLLNEGERQLRKDDLKANSTKN